MTMKLLIVEDSAPMREMIRLMALSEADEARECADGESSLLAYAEFQPDWVTMDLSMPGMDGLTATRRLKERYPDARVVVVTQHGERSMREAALEAGAAHYFLKDNLRELRALVRGGTGTTLASRANSRK
jgi:two-component system chemotaxis response regulator CheY